MNFKRMRALMNRRPGAEFRVEKAIALATKITTVISDMPKGGNTGSQVENGVLLIDAARANLDAIDTELAEMRRELKPLIKALDRPLERRALTLRYMEGYTVSEMEFLMNYSKPRIFQILQSAEKRINAQLY